MMLLVWTLVNCNLNCDVTKSMRLYVAIGSFLVSGLLVTASVRESCHCTYARDYYITMAYLNQECSQINIWKGNWPPSYTKSPPTLPVSKNTSPASSNSALSLKFFVSSMSERNTSTTLSVPSRANLPSAKIGKEPCIVKFHSNIIMKKVGYNLACRDTSKIY